MTPPGIVSELQIEGFKSFGTPGQRIALGPLNFVVGANASGKTNFISALRFLRYAVTQNAEFAVNEFGGIAEVRNKILRERTQPKPLKIDITLQNQNVVFPAGRTRVTISQFRYVLTLDLRSDSGVPEVDSEDLTADLVSEGKEVQKYHLHRTKQEVEIMDPLGEKDARRLTVPPQESSRLALDVGFYSVPCVVLRSIISEWRFYNVSPHVARLPFKDVPGVDLGPAGENLAVILHKIEKQNGKGVLDAIIAGLKSVVPGFRDIKTTQLPVEGKWAFQVLEDKIRGALNPDAVSDGTIRLLALLVISHWRTRQPSLVAIEEPENGLHPHLAEHIVSILRTAAEQRQVIVTTHNPAFLDYLEPYEILLCDKIEGFTKVRHASDVADVEKFRKHFRLGELWVQGTLGGVP